MDGRGAKAEGLIWGGWVVGGSGLFDHAFG